MPSHLPAPLISITATLLDKYYSHMDINTMFMSAGVEGDPPSGNKVHKVTTWLRQVANSMREPDDALQVVGHLLEDLFEVKAPRWSDNNELRAHMTKLEGVLAGSGLQYQRGGRLIRTGVGLEAQRSEVAARQTANSDQVGPAHTTGGAASQPQMDLKLDQSRKFGPWVPLKELGFGGQGTVHVAWRRSDENEPRLQSLLRAVTSLPTDFRSIERPLYDLLMALETWRTEYLGALKVLKHRIDAKALGRARQEVATMRSLAHPNLVKLLDEQLDQGWFVTEYYAKGSLERYAAEYRGDALKVLRAVRPLVSAVALMHSKYLLHRDIKMANVLVADDGHLVLGDLGLVYDMSADEDRLSSTFESAGTSDWMAPWARGGRIKHELANGKLDCFGLGKLIWCLIAGHDKLVYWWHRKSEYDLEKIFPNAKSTMAKINDLLDGCVVEDEQKARWQDASEMLKALDELINNIGRGVGLPKNGAKITCLFCGEGHYEMLEKAHKWEFTSDAGLSRAGLSRDAVGRLLVCVCNKCGHTEHFSFRENVHTVDELPVIWKPNQGMDNKAGARTG